MIVQGIPLLEVYLSLRDVALDSHAAPSLVQLNIKQSKTDPLCVGMHPFLRCVRGKHLPHQGQPLTQ